MTKEDLSILLGIAGVLLGAGLGAILAVAALAFGAGLLFGRRMR